MIFWTLPVRPTSFPGSNKRAQVQGGGPFCAKKLFFDDDVDNDENVYLIGGRAFVSFSESSLF